MEENTELKEIPRCRRHHAFPIKEGSMPKICDMVGVREHDSGFPVELWRDDETGRLVVVATNEGGYNSTSVDLLDLLEWVSRGPNGVVFDGCSIVGLIKKE